MSRSALLSTLHARLLVFGAVFLVLIMLLVGSVSYWQSQAAMKELQAQNLDNLVTRIASDIDDRIRTRHVLLEQAAASLQLPADTVEKQAPQLIQQFKHLKGMFNSVILYDRSGNIIADYPALPGRLGLNVGDRDYFSQTKQKLLPQVSEPLRAKGGLNRTVIVFTAPIFSVDGSFSGVLGGALELYSPEFFGELRDIAVGRGGVLTINSIRSRITIMHTDPAYIMQPSPNAALSPTLHRAFAGWEGRAVSRNRDGVPSLLAYHQLRGVPWVVGAVLPLEEALLPARAIGEQYILLVLGIIVLLSPLIWFGLRRQLRPLRDLHVQVQRLQTDHQHQLADLGCAEIQMIGDEVARALRSRDEAESRLAEREALFRVLNDASPMGVVVADSRGSLQYMNAASLRVGGLPASEMADWMDGRHWLDAIHPESLARVDAAWQSLLLDGQPLELLCRLKHSKEQMVMAEIRFVELAQLAGQRRFLGLISDVSGREEAKASLLAERERALVVLGSIKDAVVLTNQLDEIEYVNQPALQLFGLPASDMLGRLLGVFMNLVSPDSGLPVSLRMIERDNPGKPVELDLLSRDMRVQPVVMTLTVIGSEGLMHGYKVVVLHDDSERRQREHQHRWEASHDALTGLHNRRGFLAALTKLMSEQGARQHPNVLVMMDLDHFKQVNDSAGHQGGDLLLQDIATILQRHVRSSDVVARLGGDEFAILLSNCQRDVGERIMREILRDIDSHIMYLAGKEFRVTASIGLTELRISDDRPQISMERADERCYQAKRNGRNCLVTNDVMF